MQKMKLNTPFELSDQFNPAIVRQVNKIFLKAILREFSKRKEELKLATKSDDVINKPVKVGAIDVLPL